MRQRRIGRSEQDRSRDARGRGAILFIKANLNAQAIASLQGTELELGGDINNLIKQMEASIAEADRFIAQVQSSKQ